MYCLLFLSTTFMICMACLDDGQVNFYFDKMNQETAELVIKLLRKENLEFSLKFNNFNKPDYDLEQQEVSFDPPSVSAGLDSFYLQVVVYDLGKAINDSIYVDIKRTYPNGEVLDESRTSSACILFT